MKRFLFLADEHIGHTHASIGVARRLQRRGHSVAFVGARSAQAITDAGFACEREDWMDGPCAAIEHASCRAGRLAALQDWLRVAAGGATRVIERHAPDLLLFQPFLLEFYPLFHRLGVPAISFSTKPLLSPDPLVPPYTSAMVPNDALFERWKIRCEWWGARARYAAYRADCVYQQWRTGVSHRSVMLAAATDTGFPLRAENVTRPLPIDVAFRSVPELVLHAREFDLPRVNTLPARIAYLGPCVDTDPVRTNACATPSGAGPLIYCHLGTVGRQRGHMKRDLYRQVLAASRLGAGWRWLISIGDEDTVRWLRGLADVNGPGIDIRVWVPQMAALSRADVAITHGGANSVKEALHYGIPLLVLPQSADQPGLGARVMYHGVGIAEDVRRCTPERIAQHVSDLLENPSYRARALEFSRIFARYDHDEVAENMLEQYAVGRRAAR